MPTRFVFQTAPHGEGGFGRILKGRDQDLERDVAVKMLNPLVTRFDQADQERFRREARILASLSHPNIPAVYDVVTSGSEFQIIFQFIEGRTLKALVDEDGPANLGQALAWFRQIASALDHAHGRGVIHRDVKPANIIITPDGESAYLVDFGIALSRADATRLTDSGAWIGTPGYAPPEQMMGELVDQRADIYAMAVTLYETLSGNALGQGTYPELASLNQAIPPAIDALIQDCLAQKEHRLASARTFVQRLAMSLVPARPLAEVLAQGRLHEIAIALEGLSPDSFRLLPAGQRALIFVKLDDIVASDDSSLQFAARELLQLLITRGLLLPADDYRRIAEPALFWAYEHWFGHQLGDRGLRDAVRDAAAQASGSIVAVLVEACLAQIELIALDDRPDWYLHGLRELLQTLMANPGSPVDQAARLASRLQEVNRTQRSRPRAGG